MKNQLNKRILWKSVLSVVVLSVFIIMAIGSDILTLLCGFEDGGINKLDDGRFEAWYQYDDDDIVYYTGLRDKYGRWHGPMEIKHESESWMSGSREIIYHTTGNYVHGLKDGLFTTTFRSGTVKNECYKMGREVDCEKAAQLPGSEISTFDVIENEYVELLNIFNAYSFTDEYIEDLTDTLDILLAKSEFEPDDFDDYYDDAIRILEETPYDSVLEINSAVAALNGTNLLKNDELRMAVVDRYRSETSTTFDIVKTMYPNYLNYMEEGEIAEKDFETFCHDLDSTLDSYGALDPEDTFFVDSADNRFLRAVISIFEAEDPAIAEEISFKNLIWNPDNKVTIKKSILESSSSEVAEFVLSLMFMKFAEGDLLKNATEKAWLSNKGVIVTPIVTTAFVNNISATSVNLEGYIHNDGGADVFIRGIVVATYHNPTTSDLTINSGTGVGSFSVTIEGLTEGTTYYARSYATNSAGKSYGNCISFIPSAAAVSIQRTDISTNNLTIYPNPATAITTFSCKVKESQDIQLSIIDMNGQVVFEYNPGITTQGENKVQLDLSELPNGIYICQLKSNGIIQGVKKLIIAH